MSLSTARKAILQHAVQGVGPNSIAIKLGIATATVRGVLEQEGGDLGGWQAALDADGDVEPVDPADVDPYEVEPQVPYRAPGRVVLAPGAEGGLTQLLGRAESGDAKSKRLGVRISALVRELLEHLDAIEAKAAAKRKAAKEREAAQAEVKRLTEALAAARKKAGPAPKKPKATSDAGKVREWAKANGYEVSDKGRMSPAVLAAYEEAHPHG